MVQISGNDVGVWMSAVNIDNTTKTRSYATSAMYLPVRSRTNLHVVTGAFASKIITSSGYSGVSGTGVEYYVNSTRIVASLKSGGEVIVSAG